MKKNIINILLLCLILSTGCNKWLNIKPADKVLGDELFTSQKGFLSALNGVYIEMASPTLYGSNLSAGVVDVMAQYYKVKNNTSHSQFLFSDYNYTDANSKSVIDAIWVKNYAVIYNINTLIEETETQKGILSDKSKKIILGESYALRALLHFDLLRLFGPIYKTDTTALSIPYQTKTDFSIEPLLPAEAVVAKIITDLNKALDYLDNDPVITEGATLVLEADQEIQFSYRQYRLNNLAIKALLARVNLWANNKSEAYKYATDVIKHCHNREQKLFPFTTNAEVTSTTIPDRMFSSEVLFGIYNSRRADIYNRFFNPSLTAYSILTSYSKRLESMFDDDNDYRKKFWGKESINSEEVNIFLKYADISSTDSKFNSTVRYLVPLLRISELYLIAAESTNDIAEANLLVNTYRAARNCINITFEESSKTEIIRGEYLREFIGEGQMFYFYKRHAFQNLPNGGDPQVTFNMNLSSYVLPLPDSEISQRN